MSRLLKLLSVIFSLTLLTACGFAPMYTTPETESGVNSQLAAITIPAKNQRLHQLMRIELMQLMNSGGMNNEGGGQARYDLTIALSQKSDDFGIRQDASATQERLTLTASYQLKEGEKLLLEKSLTRSTSFTLVQSDFAALSAREDSAKRLAKALAADIHRQISIYFHQNKNEGT